MMMSTKSFLGLAVGTYLLLILNGADSQSTSATTIPPLSSTSGSSGECPTGTNSDYGACTAQFSDPGKQLQCLPCKLYSGSPCTFTEFMDCSLEKVDDITKPDLTKVQDYVQKVCIPRCLPGCDIKKVTSCSTGVSSLAEQGACFNKSCKGGASNDSGKNNNSSGASPSFPTGSSLGLFMLLSGLAATLNGLVGL